MKMRTDSLLLYHGSIFRVDLPLTHIGRQDLDFGPGFYLTQAANKLLIGLKQRLEEKPVQKLS